MAVVTATLFLRTQLHPDSVGQGQLYFGVIFFSLIMLMFDGFAEMTFTILRLPGFFKQRGEHMKHLFLMLHHTSYVRLSPASVMVNCSRAWVLLSDPALEKIACLTMFSMRYFCCVTDEPCHLMALLCFSGHAHDV